MVRIDANIVLRFFMKDIFSQAIEAKYILENEIVLLSNEVIAEIIYVLEKVYKKSNKDISNVLINLLSKDNIKNFDKQFVLEALEIYGEVKLDFVDCLLCAYSEVDEIKTFDKKLLKCIDKKQKK